MMLFTFSYTLFLAMIYLLRRTRQLAQTGS